MRVSRQITNGNKIIALQSELSWGNMSALLVALGVGIVSYIAVMLLFPKALPQDTGDLTRQALDRIYEENRKGESAQQAVLREGLLEESAFIRAIFTLSFMQPMYEAAVQAGYQKQMPMLLGMMVVITVVFLLLFVVIDLGIAAPLMALLIGYYLPYRHCMARIRKRNIAFTDQFPDALDMIVRSVRSGFPISVAMQMLAQNAEEPVRSEFRQIVDEIAMGRSMQDALSRLSVRINEPNIRFFVVVLSVQQETGGNLSEIIGNLSSVIRKRKQLKNKIKALTAEGRATGWVLGALPIFVFVALFFLQREYIQVFWTDPLGQMLFGTIIGMMLICAFIIKQMIDVEL